MTVPRFDEPNFTIAVEKLLGDSLPGVGAQEPLPDLVEPAPGSVDDPCREPLVAMGHPRILDLANYREAGWAHAVDGTWLRVSAAERLGRVADALPIGWELCVFDAWRSLELQAELHDAAYALPGTEPGFIAPMSRDPSMPPPHFTGGAVDVGMAWRGQPLAPGCGFDDMTELAHTAAFEDQPGPARELRRLLYWSMRAEGFVVYHHEWWHYEYGTRRWAGITGESSFYGPAEPPGSS